MLTYCSKCGQTCSFNFISKYGGKRTREHTFVQKLNLYFIQTPDSQVCKNERFSTLHKIHPKFIPHLHKIK